MKKSLVSIVMPNYNGAKYLCECIESVLQQTYSNFEFIIVDDGSTDNSREIICSYKDNRIKPIFLKENNQICNALNVGLSEATGEYIARIDSDDFWEKDKLEKQVYFLENNEEYKVCFTYVNIVNSYSQVINTEYHHLYELFHGENITQEEWVEYFITKGNRLSHPSVVFRKEVLDTVGRYNVLYLQSQDLDFWLRVVVSFPIYIYPEELVNYRWDDNEEKISRNHKDANIRFLNEVLLIKLDFFSKIKNTDFKRIFGKHFIDINATGNIEILLEKALLLILKYGEYTDLKIVGFHLLNEALQDDDGLFVLENKKAIKLKELYQYNKSHLYNDMYVQDNERQLQEVQQYTEEVERTNAALQSQNRLLTTNLNSIINSKGWRILESLRAFKNKFNKQKLDNKPMIYKRRFLLLGTENYGNLGDHKIAMTQIEFLKHFFPDTEIIEICAKEYFEEKENILQIINKNDVIFGTGGGNLGNQYPQSEEIRRDFIQSFPNNRIIIFPQSIYFTKDNDGEIEKEKTKQIYNNHKDLTIIAREKSSYTIATEMFSKEKVLLLPDIVLFTNFKSQRDRKNIATLVLRTDIEGILRKEEKSKIISDLRDMNLLCRYNDTQKVGHITKEQRKEEVGNFLEYLSESKLVVTDRLHGMIFSILTKTPCIVFSNYNLKIKGTYEWVENLNYIKFVDTIDDFEDIVAELLDLDINQYNDIEVMKYYEELAQYIG